MRPRIKICGITRSEDALAAARLGADAIGFVLWPASRRAIAPERAAEIARELPAFVTPVAVFVNPAEAEVASLAAAIPHALLQFHGDEPPRFCAGFGRPYIKAVRAAPGVDLIKYLSRYRSACAWLVDAWGEGEYGGTGRTFDWSRVPATPERPLVLSGGLDAANVGLAVRRVRPWAVDVSSGVESAPGIKDEAKIAAFVAGVRHADP